MIPTSLVSPRSDVVVLEFTPVADAKLVPAPKTCYAAREVRRDPVAFVADVCFTFVSAGATVGREAGIRFPRQTPWRLFLSTFLSSSSSEAT